MGVQECKDKGFTLNFENAQKIQFDSTRENFLSKNPFDCAIITNNPSKITRNRVEAHIYNRSENKKYRLVYNKRRIDCTTLKTYPYGY